MPEKKSFEALFDELSKTVKMLENEDVSLDEAIGLFEKGVVLTKKCTKMLDEAEKKVNLIIEETGEIVPFDEPEE